MSAAHEQILLVAHLRLCGSHIPKHRVVRNRKTRCKRVWLLVRYLTRCILRRQRGGLQGNLRWARDDFFRVESVLERQGVQRR